MSQGGMGGYSAGGARQYGMPRSYSSYGAPSYGASSRGVLPEAAPPNPMGSPPPTPPTYNPGYTSNISDPPGAFGFPKPAPTMLQHAGDPYRSFMPQAPMQKPMMATPNQVQAQPQAAPSDDQILADLNKGLLRPMSVLDPSMKADYLAKAGGNFTTPQQPMPPMPANSQPGQATSHWGPPPLGGNNFGWQPTFFPGQNEYIAGNMSGMFGQQRMTPEQIQQINWGDAINSIGQLTGRPFNPSMWSR